MTQCKLVTSPVHKTLADEMTAIHAALVAKSRATEDIEDAAVEAGAKLDAVELALENTIRDLDSALAQLDRQDPALGAQLATFPDGFGAVIDPEGEAQLDVLPGLHVRLAPFKAQATIAPIVAKLDATAVAFKAALDADTKADALYETAFAEEIAARSAVRVQLESAYGRLRDYYKARPAMAETFFAKATGVRRSPKKDAAAPVATPPASPATPS